MQISEIFYSIQGEGPNIGKPSIFLRLQGCHLRCVWCDSKFTWDFKSGKKMTTEEVIKELKKYPGKNLVITGGEPLIQQSALKELLEKIGKNYYVEMETSGSLKSTLDKYINQYNCSPKTGNSKNKKIHLEKFPAEKTIYKFIIDKKEDLEEIEELIKKYRLPKDKILLMPQGIKKSELQKKSKWLIEICKEKNYRFSPRLHINIYSNQRGK